jgi:hypothetical protein
MKNNNHLFDRPALRQKAESAAHAAAVCTAIREDDDQAAGLVVQREQGPFLLVEGVKGRCRHCGQEFERLRTTARFCSARCRMAAHRAKAK